MDAHSFVCPPSYGLPVVWSHVSIGNKAYMFGLARFALYVFYVTDMVLVWADAPTTKDIYRAAKERGVIGFDEEKLRVLVANLAAATTERPLEINFSCSSLQTISAAVKVSESLSWSFEAKLCGPQALADFFRGLCRQSLANQGLSLYRQTQLENMVRARDEYILYLEENYKTVNGTELMAKYRRQHPGSAEALLAHSKDAFVATTGALYADYLKNKVPDVDARAWRDFALMALHQRQWAEVAEGNRGAQGVHGLDRAADTSGHKRGRSPSADEFERSLRIKLEPIACDTPTLSQSPSPSKKISPLKRKRLGLIGKR